MVGCDGLQSMVGDKTFAFLLMDKEMYFSMSALQEPNLIVDRGIALHKVFFSPGFLHFTFIATSADISLPVPCK